MSLEKNWIKSEKLNMMKLGTLTLSLFGSLIFLLMSANASAQECVAKNVAVSWSAPTTRTDGSALPASEIKNYVLVYYDVAKPDIQVVNTIQPDKTDYIATGLPCTKINYAFTIAAVDTSDAVSAFSVPLTISHDGEPAEIPYIFANPPSGLAATVQEAITATPDDCDTTITVTQQFKCKRN